MDKTLILPAEILSREFDARLLQGVMALNRNWQVITGSKVLINRMIWRLPPSVYLCQTLTHKRKTMLKLLRRLGHITYGWDEEGLIYLDKDTYLSRRVSSETLELLDGLIVWGVQSAADIEERAKPAGLEPKPFGNPRFDLVRPELRGLYRQEVRKLHDKYGDYILIPTNFGMINPIISVDVLKQKKTSRRDKIASSQPARYAGLVEHRRDVFHAFIDMVQPLARNFSNLNIIIRPHPSEKFSTWEKLGKDIPNLKIVREGSSIPWQVGAKAVIHNVCTSSVESACIGHSPIAYCPVISMNNESGLPNNISHRVHNFDELVTAVKLAVNGELKMTGDQRRIFEQYVAGATGEMCTEKVLDMCENLYRRQNANPVSDAGKGLAKLQGIVRQVYRSLRINHQTDRYIPKVFPEIGVQDVSSRASLIAETLNLPFSVKAICLSKNVFKLEKTVS